MSTELNLLRLLEPAVRPGNLPAPARAGREPIEARSFDSLLEEARLQGMSDEGLAETRFVESVEPALDSQGDAESSAPRDAVKGQWLGPLAAVDAVENASLRRLMGGNS